MRTDATVAPTSCLGTLEVSSFPINFFLKNDKNCHGALIGLTMVKGTSVDKLFQVLGGEMQNMVSGTCRSYVCKRYKCAEKKVKRGRAYAYPPLTFETILEQISITN